MPGPDKLAAKVRTSGCGGSVFRGLGTFYPSCHNLPGYVAGDFLSCSCHRHLLVAYVCDWGRGGVQPGCRLICRRKVALSIFLPCICQTTRCQVVMCCGKLGFPHSVPRNCHGRGRHRKAWEFCLLASFNQRNTLYTFHVYMHFEKGCLKRLTKMTER